MSGFFSLSSNPRLILFPSSSPSFPIPVFLFFPLLLPLFQSPSPSLSLLLLPLVHPLSPFSIHPSRLCVPPSQLTFILFPLPTFPLLAAIINKKTARKPPFHRSSGRSSRCFVLRLPSVTKCPSVSLSLLLRQGVQYIQTWRSVYSDRPLSIFRQAAQYINTRISFAL